MTVFWWDVYEWTDSAPQLANAAFPEFFKRKIEEYYQPNVDKAQSVQPESKLDKRLWKEFLDVNRKMISQAQGIIEEAEQ